MSDSDSGGGGCGCLSLIILFVIIGFAIGLDPQDAARFGLKWGFAAWAALFGGVLLLLLGILGLVAGATVIDDVRRWWGNRKLRKAYTDEYKKERRP